MRKRILVTMLAISMISSLSLPVFAKTEARTENESEIEAEEEVEPESEPESEVESFDITDGFFDDGTRVDYYEPVEQSPMLMQMFQIPRQYDARDAGVITSVKNQGRGYGTCWAFATMAAGESALISRNLAGADVDLSEYQEVYFLFHTVNDPLGNLKNDRVSSSNPLNIGGNGFMSMLTLSAWRGAVKESKAPYESMTSSSKLPDSLAYDDQYHLQNTRIISMGNKADVKRSIMDYGSVFCGMNTTELIESKEEYTAYCFKDSTGKASSNHAITIIGWDDDYPVSNFTSGTVPSEPGAWLVKNSWGDISPYLWISYEDSVVSGQDAFIYLFEDADNFDFNYQYDGTVSTKVLSIPNGKEVGNEYIVSGSEAQELQAVSIALMDDNISYEVQIYKNSSKKDPRKGKAMLSEPLTGVTNYAGYYTFELDEPIYLEEGERFSVVYTLNDLDDDGKVTFFIDADQELTSDNGNILNDSYVEEGQSFFCSGVNTMDLAHAIIGGVEVPCVARIKAFTKAVEKHSIEEPDETPKLNGVCKYADGIWYYYVDGVIQENYTGIKNNEYGWWRIVNGQVDFSCNSVEKGDDGWYYILGGKVDFSYTGIAKNQHGWWRIVEGKVDFSCNSVEKNEYGWWYIRGGKVDFSYTGIAKNQYGWWRIVEGKVDFYCNSVEKNEYGWWYLKDGKVDFTYQGVAGNAYGWWYIHGGKVQFDYCGYVTYDVGIYPVEWGRVKM